MHFRKVVFAGIALIATMAGQAAQHQSKGVVYLVEVEIFEVSKDFVPKVTGTKMERQGDLLWVVTNDSLINPSFRKEPLPKGLKRIAAPKMRTLDNMEASMHMGDADRSNGIEVKVTPKLPESGPGSASIFFEKKVAGKSVLRIDREFSFSEGNTAMAMNLKPTGPSEPRTILIVTVRRSPDGV
ncbi:MAG TPA: hypothetical protein PLX06_13380 [Fimbriimonadaceae bacterium]|nr:hypothetical protein [Fimbriimonadaceae bacterium]